MVSFASVILTMVLCSGYLPMSLCTVECVCRSPAHQRSHHCLCCVVVPLATRLHVVTSPPWLLALPLPQMMANTQVVSVLFCFYFICPFCLCLFSSCLKILFCGEFVSLAIHLCLCVCVSLCFTLFLCLSLPVCVSVFSPPPSVSLSICISPYPHYPTLCVFCFPCLPGKVPCPGTEAFWALSMPKLR